MSLEMDTKQGKLAIQLEVISTIAGRAAEGSFGVVGMTSRRQIRDGLTDILRRENYKKGVIVREESSGLHIDIYIIVSFGVKISEVAHNVQEGVKYTLERILGLTVESVNVYVQGVKVRSEE